MLGGLVSLRRDAVVGHAVVVGLVYVYCAREGGACGVAPIPLECAPYLYWLLPDIELLPCFLSFEFILQCRLAL